MSTSPPSITAMPTAPSTSDPENFDSRADAWMAALATFTSQVRALGDNAYANAVAIESALAVAAANAGAAKWVSGTTYAVSTPVWSPINGLIYRRVTAGAGTTDPYTDTANWLLVTGISAVSSGIYTPAVYLDGANVAGATAYPVVWSRTDNVVTGHGSIDINATAGNTQTSMHISIPVASNFAATYNLSGAGAGSFAASGMGAMQLSAQIINPGRILLAVYPPVSGATRYSFNFGYIVQG